jgi:SUN domain-containing protein 1/2
LPSASTLDSRSKPSSPTRDRTNTTDHVDPDEPALARFARLKQREQALSNRASKSGVFTSPPKPEKWSVKDTSVNIATAFHQAASSAFDMQPLNDPNTAWASGRTATNVPRSTSVEYEKEAAIRRHATLPVPRSNVRRKPLAKTVSVRHVPDSEGEEDPEPVNSRAKSPLEQVVDLTKRALGPATFYLRRRSQEPDTTTNGKDPSYDYAEEEAEYQAAQAAQNQLPASRRVTQTHKRNRMSLDNKAYRPSASDLEEEDEDFGEEGKKGRRRKKKKEPLGGPLTTLPVTSYDKKKKRKSRGSKGNEAEMEEDDRSDSEDISAEQVGDYLSFLNRHSSERHSKRLLTIIPFHEIPRQTHYFAVLCLHSTACASAQKILHWTLNKAWNP